MAAVFARVWFFFLVAACCLGFYVTAGAAAEQADGREPRKPSLTFLYEKPTSLEWREIFKTLQDSRILEQWTAHVNRVLRRLPHGIKVVFGECGKANPRYDSKERRITFCYEEADRSFHILQSLGFETETQLLTSWIGSILFELYHELGHALVDTLWLPVLGKEEDAADQFATLALLSHPNGWALVLGSADYFHEMGKLEVELGLNHANRHPFFSQRYFNILCLTYASDPEKHKFLMEQNRLPMDRAESCRLEYVRAAYAWGTLLESVGK